MMCPVDGTVNTVAAGEGLDLFSDVVKNLVASVVANVDTPDADPNLQLPRQLLPKLVVSVVALQVRNHLCVSLC